MLDLLFLAGSRGARPTISGLTLSGTPGFCNFDSVGQPATVDAQWAISRAFDNAYEVRVFYNGMLTKTLVTSATQAWSEFAPGDVENGGQSPFEATTTVEVQLVQKSNGLVLQSLTGSYTATYGTCR